MRFWSKGTATAVLLCAVAAAVLAAWQARPAADRFTTEGTLAVATPAARAQQEAERLGVLRPDLVLLVSDPAGARIDDPRPQRRVAALTRVVAGARDVVATRSPAAGGRPSLLSRDGRTAMIQAQLRGTPRQRAQSAERVVSTAHGARSGLRVRAGGQAWTTAVVDRRVVAGLLRAELVAAPVVALLLVFMYGSVVFALLPVLVAAFSVLCAVPVLGMLAQRTDVSQFAVNAAGAVGFALAVDYTLFVLARYREHLAHHDCRAEALTVALRTSGRTVIFSAATVTAALAAVVTVPIPLLRALALAVITVTLLSAVAAWTVLPACLVVLGPHAERLDPLRRWRRHHLGGPSRTWRAVAHRVSGRPLSSGAAALVLLAACALPVLHVRLGVTDERVLPRGEPAAVAGEQQREEFAFPPERLLTVLVRADRADQKALVGLRAEIGALPHVTGVFPSAEPARDGPGTTAMVVAGDAAPDTPAAASLVRALRSTAPPGQVLVAGRAADVVDTVQTVRRTLPQAGVLMMAALGVLLTLYTRSVVAPVKAVAVGLVTMGASLGALVAVFQDGLGRTLMGGFTPTGSLDCSVMLFVLALALAISLDYEVFLLGRIKEEYDRNGDNRASIVKGISYTGRLMTSAAVSVAIPTTALAATGVTSLKIIGLGIALTVVVDAVLVRGVLVPAVMTGLGALNWWSPFPSVRKPRPDGPASARA